MIYDRDDFHISDGLPDHSYGVSILLGSLFYTPGPVPPLNLLPRQYVVASNITMEISRFTVFLQSQIPAYLIKT